MERRLAAILAADMVGYSLLMEGDEAGVLARQKRLRATCIDPEIAAHRGRIIKTTGDGLVAEFGSVQDAVRCAVAVQRFMARQELDLSPGERIRYRVGINLGDVIFDEGDVFGDAVNLTARLEAMAEPGGLCVSDVVHQMVADSLGETFRDLGRQRVKNISRSVRVWQWTPNAPQATTRQAPSSQHVSYCRSRDGTHIAYALLGEGAPVMRTPHWMNHLEYEWSSPFFGPFIERMAQNTRLLRFDQRGVGLSDREVAEISLEAMIEDMEAVADAAGFDRFALLAASQGAMFSVEYALRHPERVGCIVFVGGYLRGRLRRGDPEQSLFHETAARMIRDGWGSSNPIFRQFFTSSFVPDATPAQQAMFDELQRVTTSPENALRINEMNSNLDVTARAVQLKVPALVLHMRGDRISPLSEGRLIARSIPGAEIRELPGNNHALVEGDQAFEKFFEEALPFINRHT